MIDIFYKPLHFTYSVPPLLKPLNFEMSDLSAYWRLKISGIGRLISGNLYSALCDARTWSNKYFEFSAAEPQVSLLFKVS